jgi:hypothetical protein
LPAREIEQIVAKTVTRLLANRAELERRAREAEIEVERVVPELLEGL